MDKFNEIKAKHPNWSDEQIWTAVSLDMESTRVIENADDVDPDDKTLIDQILKGAERWLREALPVIYEKVSVFFRKAFEWIKDGISGILDWLLNRINDFPFS